MAEKFVWEITVGGYGTFKFIGTEEEAEELRAHKARWEGAVATKKKISEVKKSGDGNGPLT